MWERQKRAKKEKGQAHLADEVGFGVSFVRLEPDNVFAPPVPPKTQQLSTFFQPDAILPLSPLRTVALPAEGYSGLTTPDPEPDKSRVGSHPTEVETFQFFVRRRGRRGEEDRVEPDR